MDALPLFGPKPLIHLPIQNSEKMAPSTSSTSMRPVRRPRWRRGDAELLGLDFRPSPLLAEPAKGLRRGLELGPVAGAGDHRRLASCKPLLGAFRKQANEFGHALAGLRRQRNRHRRFVRISPDRPCSIRGYARHLRGYRRICPPGAARSHRPSRERDRRSRLRASARRMPSASTAPSASLIPAVSVTITGKPPRSRWTSITSRVVPASSDTMAASRRASAFSRDDLPAFGGPAMTTRKPSRRRSPRRSSQDASHFRGEHLDDGLRQLCTRRRRHVGLVGESRGRLRRAPAPSTSSSRHHS